MKSPFTGGRVFLQKENSELVFRTAPFVYVVLFFKWVVCSGCDSVVCQRFFFFKQKTAYEIS